MSPSHAVIRALDVDLLVGSVMSVAVLPVVIEEVSPTETAELSSSMSSRA